MAINITRDTGTTVLKTLAPDGSVQKSWNINKSSVTDDHVIGESKLLEMKFSISGDYLGGDLNNKNICFTPALFSYLAIYVQNPGFKFSNRFEFLVSDYTDTTEYDMTLVVQNGYLPEIAQNWRCTFQAIDENDFYIRFYFYMMEDEHNWMTPVGKINHNKLLRSSKYDTVDIPVTPYSTSVYASSNQRLSYYLFIEDVTDPMNTKGYLLEKFKYEAGWYGYEEQIGAPFFTNPVFSIYRNALPVTGLSAVYPTQVRFRVTAPNAFSSVTEAYLWMINVTNNNNSINFKDNYKASFAKIITDAGAGVINNMLIKPETGPTNDTGNEYFVDCFIDPSQLIYGESYRFIGIAYMKDGDTYEVNSFISQGFRVDSLPQFNGDGFEMIGTLKDYNKEFLGNELICVVEERIKSILQINFPADQYKNDILARLGLVINNDIRTYLPTIVMEIYEEVVSGPNTTKHIFDRKIFTQTSPTTYTSNTGATLTFGTDEATFDYEFRVRFESGISNLESQLNGVVLPSPTSNQNWAGRTIKIEWKLIFYYNDYVSPFEESVRFIQKIKPKNYETGAKLIIEDVRKETHVLFCNTDDMCFEAKITPGAGEGTPEQYKLMTTIEPSTGSINNIEENEEWTGTELAQLDSPKFLTQEESFSETVPAKAKFCLDPNELLLNLNYKVCAIAKRVIPSVFVDAIGFYSLRQMEGYNGSAIRIRRNSDNAELDIGFSSGALNQSQLTTFIGSDDAFVTIWYDQTGNGNNLIQTNNVYQPKIATAGTIIVGDNGLPIIDFLPAGDGIHLETPTGFLNGSTSFSIFGIWDIITSSNDGVFAPATVTSQGLEILSVSVISRPSFLRINGVIRNDNAGAGYQMWDSGVLSLTSVLGDATSVSARKNGAAISLTDSSGIAPLNFNGKYALGLYFNVGNAMSGSVQELAVFDTNQTANLSDIEDDINTFYTIY